MNLFKICPFCNKELQNGKGMVSHLRKHNTTIKKSYKELILTNVPKEILDNFKKESEYMSLPDFKEKYGLNYNQTLMLYDFFNIKPRTLKEAVSSKERNNKIKQTCLKKYGDTNVLGKKSPFYLKRNKTVKEKYGVKNVFQLKEVKEKINSDDIWLEKYNLSRHDFLSNKLKERWDNFTDEEKDNYLKKSIWKNQSSAVSMLETQVASKLLGLGFSIETQKRLPNIINKTNKNNLYYDIFIKELNLLLEVNGVYWHASHKRYKSGDYIHIGNEDRLVDNIWLSDLEKKENALKYNYFFAVIWEDEIVENLHDSFKNRKLASNLIEIIKENIVEN